MDDSRSPFSHPSLHPNGTRSYAKHTSFCQSRSFCTWYGPSSGKTNVYERPPLGHLFLRFFFFRARPRTPAQALYLLDPLAPVVSPIHDFLGLLQSKFVKKGQVAVALAPTGSTPVNPSANIVLGRGQNFIHPSNGSITLRVKERPRHMERATGTNELELTNYAPRTFKTDQVI